MNYDTITIINLKLKKLMNHLATLFI